uniref:Uncharacterized protein n=1 Tax=Magallana gigas TaxID=29159 RepID=K1P6V2_MAGGI
MVMIAHYTVDVIAHSSSSRDSGFVKMLFGFLSRPCMMTRKVSISVFCNELPEPYSPISRNLSYRWIKRYNSFAPQVLFDDKD